MSEEADIPQGRKAPSNDNQMSLFRQSLQLIAAFREIADADLRQSIIKVVKDIAEADSKSASARSFEDNGGIECPDDNWEEPSP